MSLLSHPSVLAMAIVGVRTTAPALKPDRTNSGFLENSTIVCLILTDGDFLKE